VENRSRGALSDIVMFSQLLILGVKETWPASWFGRMPQACKRAGPLVDSDRHAKRFRRSSRVEE
jgi:hypothetical protein